MAPSARLLRAVVLAAGDPLPPADLPAAAEALDAADLVVAADGGLAHAVRLGRRVDEIVGDLDSIDPEQLRAAEAGGARVHRHPVEKDATDLALALDLVLSRSLGAAAGRRIDVTVLGGHGGRADHLLGNALLLGSDRYAPLRLRALWGGAELRVVRDAAVLTGRTDDLVSLLALHGPATGVRTEGLRFPLEDAELRPGSSLGLSNRLTGTTARVSVGTGVVLTVRPTG